MMAKSSRTWLHQDFLLTREGVNYSVEYLGKMDISTSMKVLNFDTRSSIVKECILKVARAAQRIPNVNNDQHHRLNDLNSNPLVAAALADNLPVKYNQNPHVQLTITSRSLKLSTYETGEAIFVHDMPNVSFATGGDTEMSDYVAYVAKDSDSGLRSCYVLECKGGHAPDVITTIGQAFELRFKRFKESLKQKENHSELSSSIKIPLPPTTTDITPIDEVEYYNDLPGKKPPSLSSSPPSNNLIDFNSDPLPANNRPEYINMKGRTDEPSVINSNNLENKFNDPFEMSPFPATPSITLEPWFHGKISRTDSENLIKNDGDFLVRESLRSTGQYVLTGMQDKSAKHLLLNRLRTKDRTFDSVSHLINHHKDNGLPIISSESAIRLITPISKI